MHFFLIFDFMNFDGLKHTLNFILNWDYLFVTLGHVSLSGWSVVLTVPGFVINYFPISAQGVGIHKTWYCKTPGMKLSQVVHKLCYTASFTDYDLYSLRDVSDIVCDAFELTSPPLWLAPVTPLHLYRASVATTTAKSRQNQIPSLTQGRR